MDMCNVHALAGEAGSLVAIETAGTLWSAFSRRSQVLNIGQGVARATRLGEALGLGNPRGGALPRYRLDSLNASNEFFF